MEESAEGTVRDYKQLPQNKTKAEYVKDYEKQANPVLKEYGKAIVDEGTYKLLKWFVGILGVAVLVFGGLAYNGNFQTEVIQTCAEIPACVCPVCPINNCDCGDVSCGDLQFPSNLNLTVSNVSV